MKILLAPDSFKGSLSSIEAIEILKTAAKNIFGEIEIIKLPVADGGEGTVDSFVYAAKGEFKTYAVKGPLLNKVDAKYGLINDGKTAVIEMAEASGLPLVPIEYRNPLEASSFGTGQLINHMLNEGIRDIIIGIGGSATNDGGMGALIALGAKFYDKNGNLLEGKGEDLINVSHIDLSGLNIAIKNAQITVICDVKNPLLGENGATYIYGRQKGADENSLEFLEKGMENYAGIFKKEYGIDIASFEGAGAAGGIGGVLKAVLGAELKPGIEAVLDAVNFDEMLNDCDLVVTGEGQIDGQSVKYGKVPLGIAKRCGAKGVPVGIIVGSMGYGAEGIYEIADSTIITTVNSIMPLDKAMSNAKELFYSAAERLFRGIKIGMIIKENSNENM